MPTNLSVLIVEDSELDAELMIMRLASEGFQLNWQRVETKDAFLQALNEEIELILSDWSLPQFSGLTALRLMREKGINLPFIIISGSIGEEAALEALRLGAYDYILKDRPDRLGQAVRNALAQKQLEDANRAAQAALAASEAELRALFASMEDVVIVIDRDGVYCKIAPTNPRLLLLPEEELLNGKVHDFFPREKADYFLQVIHAVLDTGASQRVEYELEIDKRLIWFETTISKMTEEQVIWVARDMTERKLHEKSMREYTQRQERIVALGADLSATVDLKVIYPTLERHLRPMIGYHTFAISMLRDGQLTAEFARDGGQEMDVSRLAALPFGPAANHCGRVQAINSGNPVLISRVNPEYANCNGKISVQLDQIKSAMFVPMVAEGRVIGSLDFFSKKEDFYHQSETKWLHIVANLTGLNILNALSFANTQKRLAELGALHAIDTVVASSHDPEETFNVLLQKTAERLGVNATALLLVDAGQQTLHYAMRYGFQSIPDRPEHLGLEDCLAGQVVKQHQIVQYLDLSEVKASHRKNLHCEEDRFQAYIGLPLESEGRVIGVLEILHRSELRPNPDWLRFLELITGQAAIAVSHIELIQGIQNANEELLQAYDATIEGWSQAMDLRDKETEGHTQRVKNLTLALAERIQLDENAMVHFRRGALLHDIGKLGVPDHILHKPGPLTEEEWVIMKQHPVFAYQMLSSIEYLKPALDIPYCHHEKWDGSGYPRGLKREEIPVAARIFAVVDVWDALTSDRPYRPAWSHEASLEYIEAQSGKYFDPAIVPIFMELVAATIH